MSQDTGSPQRRAGGLERSRLSLLFGCGLSLSLSVSLTCMFSMNTIYHTEMVAMDESVN